MTELLMKKMASTRVGQIGLFPANQISEDDMATLSGKNDLLVTVKSPRNPSQFALAWALATKVAEACDWLHDKEDAMNWLKIKARHVTMLQNPRTGQVAIVPKSIAFASLNQESFARILNRMIYIVCTEIVPGLNEKQLRAEILKMVGSP